jgi:hypothetical protein
LVREKAFEFIPYGAHLVVKCRVPGDSQYHYGFAIREFLSKPIMQFGSQNGMRSKPYEVNYQLGCGPDPVSMATELFHQGLLLLEQPAGVLEVSMGIPMEPVIRWDILRLKYPCPLTRPHVLTFIGDPSTGVHIDIIEDRTLDTIKAPCLSHTLHQRPNAVHLRGTATADYNGARARISESLGTLEHRSSTRANTQTARTEPLDIAVIGVF